MRLAMIADMAIMYRTQELLKRLEEWIEDDDEMQESYDLFTDLLNTAEPCPANVLELAHDVWLGNRIPDPPTEEEPYQYPMFDPDEDEPENWREV